MEIPRLVSVVLTLQWVTIVYGVTRVSVTSPVSPVRQDGILSVHCHVYDLSDTQEVTISHKPHGGKTNRLTWDGGVVADAEDRVFLAIRQLGDGSMVYFLSVVEANRQDAGEYSCRVFESEDMKEVASGYVNIEIQYFPEEPYPLCEPKEQIMVYSGSSVTLNCSSEIGSPAVTMQWIKTGSDQISDAEQVERNGITYSELHLMTSSYDNEAVYLCQVTSVMFPDKVQRCHIGPIMVISTEDDPIEPKHDLNTNQRVVTKPPIPVINPVLNTREVSHDNSDCEQLCHLTSENSTFTWIVATCVAGLIAVIFCIIGIAISIKLYNLPRLHHESDKFHRECIYEDVDRRSLPDNKVYMALKTSQRLEKTLLPAGSSGVQSGDHYAITLCRPTPNF